MRRLILVAILSTLPSTAFAQNPALNAQSRIDPTMARFDAILQQALETLAVAKNYAVDVESRWNTADAQAPQGGGHFRLAVQEKRYRVDVQSLAASAPELTCVNDGAQVTTYFPARKLYSQHPANSPQASLEQNKMLAMSLQGSAVDILLQQDVARSVHAQATGLKDHGQAVVAGKKAHHFELTWGGAQVELFFAAVGDPLLLKFVRTATVPLGDNQHYQMVCTANFQWRIGEVAPSGTFAIALPPDAQRVAEIYDALAGHDAASQAGKPLPKLTLASLDGNDVALAAAPDKKATVLVFWATWCAASVEDFPAVHKFVGEYKDRGVAFYAINVGESPGEVRRFTAKHPLISAVLLDPRATASSALRISELPAVAIIAPDNTVRAVLHGTAKNLQAELASQLESALAGTPSKTARRTGQAAER